MAAWRAGADPRRGSGADVFRSREILQETASFSAYQPEEAVSIKTAAARFAWLLILVLAALPRLTDLNRFLIIDEPGRWEWAKQFFTALATGNPAGTMIHGYPGVLPDWFSFAWIGLNALFRSVQQGGWLGEAGLYALFHEWDRVPQHLADQRLGVVVANTLLVLLAYLLIRRAFGLKVALVSGVLIALDPFYLTDSRVNRAEAVTAGVTFASLLLFILYVREGRRRWLLLSGAAAGLACLAKIQALLMVPLLGLIALFYYLRAAPTDPAARRLGRWAGTMALWGLALGLAFWLAWPAMWVAPGATLRLVYDYATEQSGAIGVNLFFLGRVVRDQDPGPLFYPLAFALRANPLVLLGMGAGLWAWWRGRRDPAPGADAGWPLRMVAAFALLYPALMTLGSHKQDRYLLTIFPMVNLLAAPGLIWLWERLPGGNRLLAGLGALIVAQALLILPYQPYYFNYFNPLTGGGYTAPRLIRIGWGEGLDQVAAYLNRQPDPERLTVASRFPDHLVGFRGQVVPLDAGGAWTRADYLIFYIQQLQRQQDPGPGEIRWVQRYPPAHVVRLGQIEYASVYRNPLTVPADPQVSRLDGQLQLFGYIWEPEAAAVRLVWLNEAGEGAAGPRLAVRLSDGQAATPWQACEPAPGFAQAALVAGEVVESRCTLSGRAGLTGGLYDLEVGVEQGSGQVTALPFPEGRSTLSLGPDGALAHLPLAAALDALAGAALLPGATPFQAVYGGQIRLAGYEFETTEVRPGQTIWLDLYWQAQSPPAADYTTFAHLFDGETRLAAADVRHRTSRWLTGSVQRQRYELALAADAPAPAVIRLDVGLYDDQLRLLRPAGPGGQPLPWTVAQLKVVPGRWPSLDRVTPVEATFEAATGQIDLAGYEIEPAAPRPGETLNLTLYWQPQATPGENYTVFVQLLDAADRVAAQGDGPPRNGQYPTGWWAPGEVIADPHPVALPADLPPGDYRLLVGLYRLGDGARLPLTAGAAFGPDALILTTLELSVP